jgi:hypothetical protein
MLRRLFWMLVGIGLGLVVARKVSRFVGQAKQRYAPRAAVRRAGGMLDGVRDRVRVAIDAGRDEMLATEEELRSELDLPWR